jgi:hypothetical protein
MKKILLTSTTCGPCHVLKNRIKNLGLEVETKNFPDETEIFKKYAVKSLPSLLIYDEEDDTKFELIQGMDDIIARIKND